MNETQNNISKLLDDADQIVAQLKALKGEVESYKTATQKLEDVRKALSDYLKKTQALTDKVHELLTTVTEAGIDRLLKNSESLKKSVDRQNWVGAKIYIAIIVGLVVLIAIEGLRISNVLPR